MPPLPFEGVRLPSSPIAAYDPPVQPISPPQPTPQAGYGDDYEAWTQPFTPGLHPTSEAPAYPGSNVYGGGPVVYRTKKKWQACDVYIDMPVTGQADTLQGAVISVYVHAISQQGAPTLVATGRWRCNEAGGAPYLPPRWIAAARSGAQTFQVSVGVWLPDAAATSTTLAPFSVTVVAANEAVAPPPFLGVITTGPGDQGGGTPVPTVATAAITIAGYPDIPQAEIVGVQAINTAGGTVDVPAARYLQYYEEEPTGPQTPLMVWPMGSVDGDGIVDFDVRWRNQTSLMYFKVSSTPVGQDFVDDGVLQVFVR